MKLSLFVVVALAVCVAAQPKITVTSAADGKWTWNLLDDGGKPLLPSNPFADKGACVRSAVALLANGADRKRCQDGVVVNSNNQPIGVTKEGEQDVASEKAQIRLPSNAKVNCPDIAKAIRSIVSGYVKTHTNIVPKDKDPKDSKAKPIGATGLVMEVLQSDQDDQFYFHIKAANGEIVLRSEMYTEKASALKGLESVLVNGGVKSSYTVVKAKDGQFAFNIKGRNEEIVGASETYTTKGNSKVGQQGVQTKVRQILRDIVESSGNAVEQQQQHHLKHKHKPSTLADPEQQKKPEQQNGADAQPPQPKHQHKPSRLIDDAGADAQPPVPKHQHKPSRLIDDAGADAQPPAPQFQKKGGSQRDDNDVQGDDETDEADMDDDDEADF